MIKELLSDEARDRNIINTMIVNSMRKSFDLSRRLKLEEKLQNLKA